MRAFITICSLLCIYCHLAKAQSISCPPNIDFETGSYTNWSFDTGSCCPIVTIPSGQIPNRHELTNGATTDFYGGFPIVAPGGGSHSLKLGNNATLARAEKARYYISVPASINNYSLVYRYAVVFQDPNHQPSEQPRFDVNVFDAATSTPLACNQFSYVASSNLPGFQLSSKGMQVYYKNWTTATLDLSGQNGKTIIVEFSSGDCELGGHFGYGYVDLSCGLFAVQTSACAGAPLTNLSAPQGFQSYTWYNSSYSTIIGYGQSLNIPTPASNSVYHVALTPYPGYGCPDTLSTHVIVSDLSANILNNDTTICNGDAIPINTQISSSYPPIVYNWTQATTLSCSNCPLPVATPTAAITKYVLTVTDSANCVKKDSVTMTITPFVTVTTGDVSCHGGNDGWINAIATGISPFTYSWNTSPIQTTPNISNLTVGPYTLTVTDGISCNKSFLFPIFQPPAPLNATISNHTDARCHGTATGSATVSAAGGTPPYIYSWNTTPPQNSPTAANLPTGNYTVTVTDANACTQTAQVTISQPATAISASITNITHIDCFGSNSGTATATASGGTPPYTYTWNSIPAQTTPNASSLYAGSYDVTVKDAKNCTIVKTATILQSPALNIVTTNIANTCRGLEQGMASVAISGGIPPYAWTWNTNPAQSTDTIKNLAAGAYTVSVTDDKACTGSATVAIAEHENNLSAGEDKSICRGQKVTLDGSGGNTYSWWPTANLSCINCTSPEVTPRITTTFTVTGLTITHNCPDTDEVVITVIEKMPIAAGADVEICAGNEVRLHAEGGTGYLWLPAHTLDNAETPNPLARPGETTTYFVVISQNNCFTDTLYQNVIVHPKPTISLGKDQRVVTGTDLQLNAVTNDAKDIRWTPPTHLSCYDCFHPVASILKTITYTATVTSDKGCVSSDDILITANCDDVNIFMPNTFSPNGDGNNDQFFPMSNGTNRVDLFSIYSRWGELLYSIADIATNDASAGWEGKYKGAYVTPDVFVYILKVRCADGEPMLITGDITLVR